MKNLIKAITISTIFISLATILSCKDNKNPNDINLSCQRLSSCINVYGNLILNDLDTQKIVLEARQSQDESRCAAAIEVFTKKTEQTCPF